MHLLQPELHTRRAFLRRSTQLGLAGTALPFALNLAAMGEAAAFNATDYKALVCVFLYGGNDYATPWSPTTMTATTATTPSGAVAQARRPAASRWPRQPSPPPC